MHSFSMDKKSNRQPYIHRYNDDDFNYNHGIALAATRNYKAAEEALLLIHNVRTLQ